MEYTLTGNVPDLEDPFGDTLRHAPSEDRLRIWSLGRDGQDNGGEGEWIPIEPEIVIEIPR